MNLIEDSFAEGLNEDYWVMLEPVALRDSQRQTVIRLRAKFERSLIELGNLDLELKGALDGLRSDITDASHDDIQGQLAATLEPEVRGAIAALAERLTHAAGLVDELLQED